MAIDLAPSAIIFIFLHLFELLYFIGPVIFFKIKKWDVKYEIKKRIYPINTDPKYKAIEIIKGMIIGVSFIFIAAGISLLIRKMVITLFSEEIYQTASESSINTTPPSINYFELIIIIIFNYVLVAFCEEFFYRGVIFEHLKQINPKKAALVSSLLFAIYHVPPGLVPFITTIVFFPYYFIFGLILCKIVQNDKGNLLTAIIAHGTMNAILYLI
jgi:membrane protease YdiL (CAAX protease family)